MKRTYLPLLGIDILTLTGAAAVRHALDTGELVRVSNTAPQVSLLPWPFRLLFSASLFWGFGEGYEGYFMPFRADESEPATRLYLDRAFAPGGEPELQRHAHAAALLITDAGAAPSDRALGGAFARALASRFVPARPLPDAVLDAAAAQTRSLGDALVP